VNFWQMSDGLEMYSLPITEPGGRVKFAAHNKLENCDPKTVRRAVDLKEQEEARRLLSITIPDLAAQDMVSETCLYTMTPDKEFAMGPLPDIPEVLLGAFSGHGFKFAPVLGEILADMAMGNKPRFDVSGFEPGRFFT
jgi:sarcosine oxidase